MKLRRLLLVLLAVSVITVCTTVTVIQQKDFFRPVVAQSSTPYVFFVDTEVGFDVGTDGLRLGAIAGKSRARRDITVSHETASSVRVSFFGNGSDMLFAEPSHELALADGSATFTIGATPRTGAPFGEYSGDVLFTFYK